MIRAATSTFFLLLLLLLLLHHQSSSPAAAATHHGYHQHQHQHQHQNQHQNQNQNPPDIVNKTCKHIADGDPNVNYTFCLESLRSVPRSKRADLRGLALISLKLSKTEAKRARASARALLAKAKGEHHGGGGGGGGGGRYEKSCLETCLELYAGAADGLRDALRAVRSGRYPDANVYASGAVDAPGDCESGFEEGAVESPLREEDHRLFQLATIGLAITSLLG